MLEKIEAETAENYTKELIEKTDPPTEPSKVENKAIDMMQ